MELRREFILERGPNGRRLCTWCRKEVPKKRRTWCSRECVTLYMVQASPAGFRSAVWDRDEGVCAICEIDTDAMYTAVLRRREKNRDFIYIPFTDKCRWEADHILPISEGGADSLDNARTLCVPCHRSETKKLRRRLAEKRRVQKTLPLEAADA